MDRTWVKAGLKYAVLSPNDVPSLLVQRVARLRASDVTSSDFIALQIASPEFTRYVLDIQTGLGVPHISGKQIADYRFRLPSPSKQTQIIEQLDNARRASNRLIELQQTKLLHLEQLKRSLLHIAFTPDLPKRDLLAA
jgi:type I restriction enzyme S subunit